MEDRKQKALSLFVCNFNCAQSVLGAFCSDYGMDETLAYKLVSGFGGGLRCGEICGAVTGAAMVIGLKHGQDAAGNRKAKENCNQMVSAFMERYQAQQASVVCRDLLGYDIRDVEARDRNHGRQKEVCPNAICAAVQILEDMGF